MRNIDFTDSRIQADIRNAYNAWRVTEDAAKIFDPKFIRDASEEIAEMMDQSGIDEDEAYKYMYFFLVSDMGVKVF